MSGTIDLKVVLHILNPTANMRMLWFIVAFGSVCLNPLSKYVLGTKVLLPLDLLLDYLLIAYAVKYIKAGQISTLGNLVLFHLFGGRMVFGPVIAVRRLRKHSKCLNNGFLQS